MSDYPAPDFDNPRRPPNSWGEGQNNYTFPSQDRPQSPPYFQVHQGQPAAYGQQPGYQPQPMPYTPQFYVPQPQYAPMVPVVPVAIYDPNAGLALAGMIIGLIAFVLPVFWIMPILGIVLSSLGMKSTTRKGMATAGLVCSIVAMATAFCWFPFFFI